MGRPKNNPEHLKNISNNLKKLMLANNLNQTELASILKVHKVAVGSWVLQKQAPSLEMLEKIASYFNITTSDLLENKEGDGMGRPKKDPEKLKIVSQNLKRLLNTKKMNQTELAKALNLNKTAISAWILEKQLPTTENLNKLAAFFEVTPTEILQPYTETGKKRSLDKRTREVAMNMEAMDDTGKDRMLSFSKDMLQIYKKKDEPAPATKPLALLKESKTAYKPIPRGYKKVETLARVSAGHGIYYEYVDETGIAYVSTIKPKDKHEYNLVAVGDSMLPKIKDGDILLVRDRNYTHIELGDIVVVRYDDGHFVKKLALIDRETYLVSLNPEYKPIKIPDYEWEQNSAIIVGKVISWETPFKRT